MKGIPGRSVCGDCVTDVSQVCARGHVHAVRPIIYSTARPACVLLFTRQYALCPAEFHIPNVINLKRSLWRRPTDISSRNEPKTSASEFLAEIDNRRFCVRVFFAVLCGLVYTRARPVHLAIHPLEHLS